MRTLDDLKQARAAALKTGARWELTAGEVAIIMADDKNLYRANLYRANLENANLETVFAQWQAEMEKEKSNA